MEIIFLGTGAGLPSTTRNTQSIFLDFSQSLKETWLIDCGEATQHQILKTSIKLSKLTKIFITHLHGDHVFGLPGLLSSRSFHGGKDLPLSLYGPKGIKQMIETILSLSQSKLNYPLTIIEFDDDATIIDTHYQVEVKKLEHGIDSYGYRITLPNKPGALDALKLKQLEIPSGPLYKRIKEGHDFEWQGKIYQAQDFIGEEQPGKIIVICGDSRSISKTIDLAKNADILIHEATYLSGEDEHLAYNYFHTTLPQLKNISQAAQVKKTIATHISSRYLLEDIPNYQLSDIMIATDFLKISIKE